MNEGKDIIHTIMFSTDYRGSIIVESYPVAEDFLPADAPAWVPVPDVIFTRDLSEIVVFESSPQNAGLQVSFQLPDLQSRRVRFYETSDGVTKGALITDLSID